MNIITTLSQSVADALKSLYGIDADAKTIVLQDTRKEFKGDYTLVVFPYVKQARKAPEAVANEIGEAVKNALPVVSGYNVIKGFLNFEISDAYWTAFVAENTGNSEFGIRSSELNEAPVVVVQAEEFNGTMHALQTTLLVYPYTKEVKVLENEQFVAISHTLTNMLMAAEMNLAQDYIITTSTVTRSEEMPLRENNEITMFYKQYLLPSLNIYNAKGELVQSVTLPQDEVDMVR